MQYSFEFVLFLHFHKQLYQRNPKIVLNTFRFNTNSIGLTKQLALYFLYLSTLGVFMQNSPKFADKKSDQWYYKL